jgi:transposase-like protein
MGKPRRSFTPEFKQNSVDLCRRGGKSKGQVARHRPPRGNASSAILLSP